MIGIASHSGAEPRQLWRDSRATMAESARKSKICGRNCIEGIMITAANSRIVACAIAGAAVSDSATTIKEIVPAVQINLRSFRPNGPQASNIALMIASLSHSWCSQRKFGAEYE